MILASKSLLHLTLNRQSATYALESVVTDVLTLAGWFDGECMHTRV
jgi:hypothetical protein